jgi:uric acid transporter
MGQTDTDRSPSESGRAVIGAVDQILPPQQLAAFGLQHVLVMYAGAVAVPLIVGGALDLPPDQVAFLISADLFACGLATLVQTLGILGVGVRLPVMMGVSFASVAPMMAMIATGRAAHQPQGETLSLIYGAVIVAGLVAFLAAPFVARLARLFPPLVTGTVILVIGLSLLNIGLDWVGGGQPGSPGYGAPFHLLIAGLVLGVILLVTRFAKGFFNHIAVLAGIIVGCMAAGLMGGMDFSHVADAPWFGPVLPFHFGLPRVEPVSALTMCLVMLTIMIESLGMFLAVGRMVDRPMGARDIVRGFRADALGAILGGVFNTFPYTSFSQNVGLVGVTNVRSRYVCAAAGGIMLLLGLSPKMAALVAAVPTYVLGGAGLVMFGMVAATGVLILGGVDFVARRHNRIVVAVSVSIGMIPVLAPGLLKAAPAALSPLLGSGIVLATFSVVLLNLYYNGFAPAGESAFSGGAS